MRTHRSYDAISVEERKWRMKFGDKLKRLIHIRNMTQGQFAAKLGISEVTLSRYVTGTYTPNPYILPRMAELLDVTTDCLLDVDGWL